MDTILTDAEIRRLDPIDGASGLVPFARAVEAAVLARTEGALVRGPLIAEAVKADLVRRGVVTEASARARERAAWDAALDYYNSLNARLVPRHTMVAIYDQFFAFTREDVRRLRAAGELCDGEGFDPEAATMRSLADRIEALLPPE